MISTFLLYLQKAYDILAKDNLPYHVATIMVKGKPININRYTKSSYSQILHQIVITDNNKNINKENAMQDQVLNKAALIPKPN